MEKILYFSLLIYLLLWNKSIHKNTTNSRCMVDLRPNTSAVTLDIYLVELSLYTSAMQGTVET